MITTAKEFLRECRKDKAFKESVDAINNQHIIDFAEAYAELRLSNIVGRSKQLLLEDCPNKNDNKPCRNGGICPKCS